MRPSLNQAGSRHLPPQIHPLHLHLLRHLRPHIRASISVARAFSIGLLAKVLQLISLHF